MSNPRRLYLFRRLKSRYNARFLARQPLTELERLDRSLMSLGALTGAVKYGKYSHVTGRESQALKLVLQLNEIIRLYKGE